MLKIESLSLASLSGDPTLDAFIVLFIASFNMRTFLLNQGPSISTPFSLILSIFLIIMRDNLNFIYLLKPSLPLKSMFVRDSFLYKDFTKSKFAESSRILVEMRFFRKSKTLMYSSYFREFRMFFTKIGPKRLFYRYSSQRPPFIFSCLLLRSPFHLI